MTESSPDPVFPPVTMHAVRPNDPVVARVHSSTPATSRRAAGIVRHVEVDVSGTPLEGAFRAGQSFGVVPPGQTANGKPHGVRLYSIASPTRGEDGAGKILSTTTKRVISEFSDDEDVDRHELFLGVCSNHLCDLRPGDEVLVAGPNGKGFLLPEAPEQHNYIFLATGTGIAPFRGFLKELLEGESPCPSKILLMLGVPWETDLLYREELEALAQKHDNLELRWAISRENHHPDRGPYVHDRLEREWSELESRFTDPKAMVYACGLAGMQVGVFRLLAQHGLTEQFLKIRDEETAAMDPTEWDGARIKRFVRPGARTKLEVY